MTRGPRHRSSGSGIVRHAGMPNHQQVQWDPSERDLLKNSGADHNDPLSPTRDTRYRRRPPTRPTNHAESVLRRLKIMGSADSNPSFRSCHIQRA